MAPDVSCCKSEIPGDPRGFSRGFFLLLLLRFLVLLRFSELPNRIQRFIVIIWNQWQRNLSNILGILRVPVP